MPERTGHSRTEHQLTVAGAPGANGASVHRDVQVFKPNLAVTFWVNSEENPVSSSLKETPCP